MPNSLREVKIRIESTKNTSQITKAMYMVSQAKVKKASKVYYGYQGFLDKMKYMVSQILSASVSEFRNYMIDGREVKKTAYILVTSDRGLAGAYNANIFKKFLEIVKDKDKNTYIASSIGKMGYSFLKKQGYNNLLEKPIYVRDDVMFDDIDPLFNMLVDKYKSCEVDEIVVIYTHYINSLTQEVLVEKIMPLSRGNIKIEKHIDYNYESGIEYTLNTLIPIYIENLLYSIILDAKMSEHSCRMNSMKNATDNAKDVIDKLQLIYNKARQDSITSELTDIIGGAQAIGGEN